MLAKSGNVALVRNLAHSGPLKPIPAKPAWRVAANKVSLAIVGQLLEPAEIECAYCCYY